MNYIKQKIAAIERVVDRKFGDEFSQALADAHHEVLCAIVLKIQLERVSRAEQTSNDPPQGEMDQETRIELARRTRAEDARYREIGRGAYLAELPTSYTCGKCGETVAFDLDKALRVRDLPVCGCSFINEARMGGFGG